MANRKPYDDSLADHQELVHRFHSETDTGAALIGAAFVDDKLTKYLADFIEDPKLKKEMFGDGGMLRDFGSKIKIAKAFGLLQPDMCRDLDLIRKIRNKFAHVHKGVDFNSSPVRDWADELRIKTALLDVEKRPLAQNDRARLPTNDRKVLYLLTVADIGLRLYKARIKRRAELSTDADGDGGAPDG